MFDDLTNNGDSYRRLRRLACVLCAVSFLILIAVYVWHTLNAPPENYVLFEAIPMSSVEMGLFLGGGLLGVLLAICLFGFSFVRRPRSD